MRNTAIVKAWNAVNPTAAQKKRMRAALEDRLDGVEKAGMEVKEKHPETSEKPIRAGKGRYQYRSAQPAKPRGSVFVLMAAMLAVVISGGLFVGMLKGNPESASEYAASVPSETVPVTESATLPEGYQAVIQKCTTAFAEDWTPEQCTDNYISLLISYMDSPNEIGYALRDLDGDGSEELLITDGNILYNMYSLSQDGTALFWLTSMERDRFYLCEDNVIAEEGSSGAAYAGFSFYKFTGLGLDAIVQIGYDAMTNPENPWYREQESITEEEADEIFDSYPHVYIPHYTLSGQPPVAEAELPEEDVLNLYAEEIALQRKKNKDLLLYCFYDYDYDGENELLLGRYGTVSVVLEEGEGAVSAALYVTVDAGESYPCENGMIEYVSSGHHRYEDHTAKGGGKQVDFVYRDGDIWYQDPEETGEGTPISEKEAQAVQANYQRVSLPWKLLSQFPVPILEPKEDAGNDLFENVFLPLSASENPITEEQLKAKMEENGYPWNLGEGLLSCYAPGNRYAWLSAVLEDTSTGLGEELSFGLFGEVEQLISAKWEEDGVHYLISTDRVGNGVRVNSVEELRDFLNADMETLRLQNAAETFAYAYFRGDETGMLGYMASSEGGISPSDRFPENRNIQIEALTGLEKALDSEADTVEVGAAFCWDSTDSYSYLTMELTKVEGEWKVSRYWLEK